MQVMGRGTGRVAGEPTLEDEAVAKEGGPGGPGWSRWAWSGEAGERGRQVLPWRHAHSQTPPEVATCRTGRLAPPRLRDGAGGQGLGGAGVLEVSSDPSS